MTSKLATAILLAVMAWIVAAPAIYIIGRVSWQVFAVLAR